MPASKKSGVSTQYRKRYCVSTINKRFGHRINRKNAIIDFSTDSLSLQINYERARRFLIFITGKVYVYQ